MLGDYMRVGILFALHLQRPGIYMYVIKYVQLYVIAPLTKH